MYTSKGTPATVAVVGGGEPVRTTGAGQSGPDTQVSTYWVTSACKLGNRSALVADLNSETKIRTTGRDSRTKLAQSLESSTLLTPGVPEAASNPLPKKEETFSGMNAGIVE